MSPMLIRLVTGVSIQRRDLYTETHPQGEQHVKMKAEVGVMLLEAQGQQPEAGREAWNRFCSTGFRGTQPRRHLHLTSGLQDALIVNSNY